MKIHITLKDPHTMHDAVTDAVAEDVKHLSGLSDHERAAIANERAIEIQSEISDRWMEYGEYLRFEVDTDTWTATILPSKG